jgi:hypothetical protein
VALTRLGGHATLKSLEDRHSRLFRDIPNPSAHRQNDGAIQDQST